jgi:hypothetical protein
MKGFCYCKTPDNNFIRTISLIPFNENASLRRRLTFYFAKVNYCGVVVVPTAVSLSRLKIRLKRKVFDNGLRFIPLPEGTR